MDTKQLNYFLKVVEYENFTQAAKFFSISQSAVTQSIRSLEKELNITLFVRSNKGIRLSKAGELFYESSKNILKELDKLNLKLNSFRNLNDNLDLYTSSGAVASIFQSAAGPRIEPVSINVTRVDDTTVIKNVLDKNADVGITSRVVNDPNLECVHLTTETLSMVVPSDDLLAKKDHITLSDLNSRKVYFCRVNGIIGAASQSLLYAILREQIDAEFTMEISIDSYFHKLNKKNDLFILTDIRQNSRSLITNKNKVIVPFESDEVRADYYFIYRNDDKNRLAPVLSLLDDIKIK